MASYSIDNDAHNTQRPLQATIAHSVDHHLLNNNNNQQMVIVWREPSISLTHFLLYQLLFVMAGKLIIIPNHSLIVQQLYTGAQSWPSVIYIYMVHKYN